jgi:hypothetical protein
MVDSDSQKDQGGNPLGEGTIMGSDGERPAGKRDNYMHSRVADFDSTVKEMEKYQDGVNGYGQGDSNQADGWNEGDFRIGDQWFDGADGDPVPSVTAALVSTAGEMEDILGLSPPTPPSGGFMAWKPGMHGRGLMINGEPHTWNAYDPSTVEQTGTGDSHSQYVRSLGINPSMVDWHSGVEIRPTGEVENLTGRDPMPYIKADPRLKPQEGGGDLFSIQPTMQPTSRTLDMTPYTPWAHQADVQFDMGPDANVPQHKITVQPGPLGIHAGHTKYLRFLDAHVNGIPARQNAGQIISRYGLHDSPEFGQPVEIGVHDPAHIAPIVEQIQSSQGAIATPRMKELGHKIQSGQLPPPPGIDPASIAPVQQAPAPEQGEVPVTARTAGPALAIGGEALLGGGAAEAAGGAAAAGGEGAAGGGMLSGGLGGMAPSLMKGALFRQGENMIGGGGGGSAPAPSGGEGGGGGPQELSQLAAILVADYETPSSNPDVGTKHDDPEDVDQKEFNDKDNNPNPKNPNTDDSGASGEDAVREHAGFAPDSPGIERLGLLLPLVLHYFNSAESGADDPMLKGLHEVLEAENPGYLDNVTPEDEQEARRLVKEHGTHQHDKHQGKVALVPPMQNGYVDPAFQQQQAEQLQGQMPVAAPQAPPGGAQQQGHCPNCGGVLTADGTCPQCGAKQNPMGGSNIPGQTPLTGGPSMPAQISAHYDILAALVDSANHQGPITPEQIAAVQQLLIKQHRVHEVPNVPLNPGDYAKEMSEIQQVPNVAPQVPQGEQTSPPAPAMGGAPGGMPMPGMGGEAGGAPMQPMSHIAADNVAGRCPNCNSASTGMLMDEGGHQRCHSCGNIWKNDDAFTDKSVNKETRVAAPAEATPDQTQDPNPSSAPAAERHHPRDIENEQDSSLTWKDVEGQPLQAGQEYEMHSNKWEVPDIVRIERVKPDGLDVSILGTFSNEDNSLTAQTSISHEEAQLENLTFTRSPENADQRGEVPPGAQTPGDQQIPPSGQTTDEVANSTQQQVSSVQDNDHYFGGVGAAAKALSAMQQEYGPQKGEHVFNALLEKRRQSMVTEADIRQAEMLAAQAQSTGNVVQSLSEIPEPVDDDTCPKCGNLRIESSMSSPTTIMHDCFRCGHVWESRDEMPDYGGAGEARSWVMESSGPGGDDFFGEMERARAMAASGQMGSRNLSDIAAKDTRMQQIGEYLSSQASERQERIAGKHFTPSEQRALIDEDGHARNSDMLQLQGTHYRTRYDFTGKANGSNVPEGHLVMGV